MLACPEINAKVHEFFGAKWWISEFGGCKALRGTVVNVHGVNLSSFSARWCVKRNRISLEVYTQRERVFWNRDRRWNDPGRVVSVSCFSKPKKSEHTLKQSRAVAPMTFVALDALKVGEKTIT